MILVLPIMTVLSGRPNRGAISVDVETFAPYCLVIGYSYAVIALAGLGILSLTGYLRE
jgi:hypothetical protein